jgi:hypothetical protein
MVIKRNICNIEYRMGLYCHATATNGEQSPGAVTATQGVETLPQHEQSICAGLTQ